MINFTGPIRHRSAAFSFLTKGHTFLDGEHRDMSLRHIHIRPTEGKFKTNSILLSRTENKNISGEGMACKHRRTFQSEASEMELPSQSLQDLQETEQMLLGSHKRSSGRRMPLPLSTFEL
jgi:hypothetical protein